MGDMMTVSHTEEMSLLYYLCLKFGPKNVSLMHYLKRIYITLCTPNNMTCFTNIKQCHQLWKQSSLSSLLTTHGFKVALTLSKLGQWRDSSCAMCKDKKYSINILIYYISSAVSTNKTRSFIPDFQRWLRLIQIHKCWSKKIILAYISCP
jgi:hypothetical protein